MSETSPDVSPAAVKGNRSRGPQRAGYHCEPCLRADHGGCAVYVPSCWERAAEFPLCVCDCRKPKRGPKPEGRSPTSERRPDRPSRAPGADERPRTGGLSRDEATAERLHELALAGRTTVLVEGRRVRLRRNDGSIIMPEERRTVGT